MYALKTSSQIKHPKAKANRILLEQVFETSIFMNNLLTFLPLGTIPLVLGRNGITWFDAAQIR